MLFMHSLFGWRGAFLGAAILGFAAAAALLLMPDTAPARTAKTRSQEAASDTNWRLLISTPILINFLFFIVLSFSSFGFMNFSVVALGALHGTPVSTANAALSGYLVCSAVGVLVGGLISSRTTHHALIAVAGISISAIATLAIGMLELGAVALVTVASIGGLCLGAIMPARDMIVRAVTPPGAFGKVFGFVTNGFNIGGVISPLVFGALMDQGQPRLVFMVIAAGGLAGIATMVSVPRRRAG